MYVTTNINIMFTANCRRWLQVVSHSTFAVSLHCFWTINIINDSFLRNIFHKQFNTLRLEMSANYASDAIEKRRIMKNVLLISIAFLCNFNAFQGLTRLQSSLNRVEGMGVITSSIIYASLVLSCMFVPKSIINLIGHKWTMTISFSGYILYMAANGYAVWGTLTTAAILVGLCAAPLWTAQCSYFTIIGQRYARLNKESETSVVSRFFGIFFMFFQTCEF